jgi:pimeloyl-ACP methyl ester carboxylesterase
MKRSLPQPMESRTRRYWLRLTLFTLVMVGVGALSLIFVVLPIRAADVVSYPPRQLVCCQTPADVGLHYEDVSFPTSDGVTLRGWYIPGQNGATILFAHGGGSNRLGFGQLEQAAALAQHGFGVLLFDQRDHGASDGTQTSFTSSDVVAALNYLHQRSDVDPDRIGAIGLSLGAINIVHAAAHDDSLKAIVLDGLGQSGSADLPPPTSLAEVLPAAQRSVMFLVLRLRGIVDRPVIDSLSRMPPRPTLFISGAGQDLEREAVRRYFAVTSEPKEIWEIPEGSHAYTWAARPQEYIQRIVDFFEQSLLK